MTHQFITHLLCLPRDHDFNVVYEFARARYPGAQMDRDEVMRIGPSIVLFGPIQRYVPNWQIGEQLPDDADLGALSIDAAHTLRLAPSAVLRDLPMVYAITTPKERDDPSTADYPDADGLNLAFTEGMPLGAEEHAVDLVVAVARRLAGAVVIGETGHSIKPEIAIKTDLSVYSPYWVGEQELGAALRTVAKTAALAGKAASWKGPAAEAFATDTETGELPLTEADIAHLHSEADKFDAEALAAGDNDEAYAWNLKLGRRGRQGLVEVRVSREELPVAALQGLDWADRAVNYQIVWGPPDEDELYTPHPGPAHIKARAEAIEMINQLAIKIQEVTLGTVVDDDGFILQPETLAAPQRGTDGA